jgi:RNA polymerase sigma-70 factor, ECF subfamily
MRPRTTPQRHPAPAAAYSTRTPQPISGVSGNTRPGERNLLGSATLFISAMGDPLPEDVIERIYRESGTQLWKGIYAFSGGRADIADEAVAEAFARALENTGRIRSPLPWLYRVAFRQASKRLRDERRNSAVPADSLSEGVNDSTSELSLGALAVLAPKQRAVVFLFYYADLSIADIAGATGSNRVAVRVQLHRAREALRRRYGTAAVMRERSSIGGSE